MPHVVGAGIPIASYDLAFCIEETALRLRRSGWVEGNEGAFAEVECMKNARIIRIGSCQFAAGVDPVNAGIAICARNVDLSEDTIAENESVRVAIGIIEVTGNRKYAISVEISRSRVRHIDGRKAVLCCRHPGKTQNHAEHHHCDELFVLHSRVLQLSDDCWHIYFAPPRDSPEHCTSRPNPWR
jgi:hypothetical protein